jgi:hypothetical protein
VQLSPYDLHHAHVFLAHQDQGGAGAGSGHGAGSGAARLGLLFHAAEYPAWDAGAFPYHLGYCQVSHIY